MSSQDDAVFKIAFSIASDTNDAASLDATIKKLEKIDELRQKMGSNTSSQDNTKTEASKKTDNETLNKDIFKNLQPEFIAIENNFNSLSGKMDFIISSLFNVATSTPSESLMRDNLKNFGRNPNVIIDKMKTLGGKFDESQLTKDIQEIAYDNGNELNLFEVNSALTGLNTSTERSERSLWIKRIKSLVAKLKVHADALKIQKDQLNNIPSLSQPLRSGFQLSNNLVNDNISNKEVFQEVDDLDESISSSKKEVVLPKKIDNQFNEADFYNLWLKEDNVDPKNFRYELLKRMNMPAFRLIDPSSFNQFEILDDTIPIDNVDKKMKDDNEEKMDLLNKMAKEQKSIEKSQKREDAEQKRKDTEERKNKKYTDRLDTGIQKSADKQKKEQEKQKKEQDKYNAKHAMDLENYTGESGNGWLTDLQDPGNKYLNLQDPGNKYLNLQDPGNKYLNLQDPNNNDFIDIKDDKLNTIISQNKEILKKVGEKNNSNGSVK
jgi:hypothetical protein